MPTRTKHRQRPLRIFLGLAMVVVSIVFAFPVLWAVMTSLKSPSELIASPPVWVPTDPQWSNYTTVLSNTPVVRYLMNSFVIVAGTVAVTLVVCVPAAYGLSRFVFRGKATLSNAVLAAQLFSPVVLAIPLYSLLAKLGLLNNYPTLILVYAALIVPFITWFLKGYFDTIPGELDEAALIDGVGRAGALWHAVLPAARPGIASAVVFSIVMSWSQFVVPFILLDKSTLYPVSVGLVTLQSTTGEITTHYLAAGAVIAVAPVVVLFVLLQRHIVSALTQGAVKG
ncbi:MULTISPECIES: carbohydrate ABC transporter permease [Microbacterium]|uniref:carbohydrate ABC transporter permease n=1 Tax=Microbacterium TaxID=33882 RepID=UPI0020C03A5B|nr:carbohydrate ABC transporter permease [Microbacterium aurugineum]MCK8475852.1 carbohydrate ABC transporter permease [Microbacterium aurugineum]